MLNYRPRIRIPARSPRSWENLMGVTAADDDLSGSPLQEVENFGSNPGALRMFTYSPTDLAPGSALVVVLHGCTQTAAGYDHGAGWSTLADRYGFALALSAATETQQPERLLQLVPARRHQARPRRGAFDPADGGADRSGQKH